MPITGRDLRAERRLADITVVDIAARMGLSRQSVWIIERSAALTPAQVEQYRKALVDATEASKARVA